MSSVCCMSTWPYVRFDQSVGLSAFIPQHILCHGVEIGKDMHSFFLKLFTFGSSVYNTISCLPPYRLSSCDLVSTILYAYAALSDQLGQL